MQPHDSRSARQAMDAANRLAPPIKPVPPKIYMPAMPPLGWIHALEVQWWHYRRRRLFLRHVLPIAACDDILLADIGYRREQILWAARLPLKCDALSELERLRAASPGEGSQRRGQRTTALACCAD
ncbi:hypothetical protein [Salinicola endophyticus]|uniref:DUF1127 domain-containing protein n=1 Tax=Salinicola endophyticus TaxID=1949083 RepID=A0AB74UEH4_9GAMM